MKAKNLLVYIVDDKIIWWYLSNDKSINEKLPKIINNGKISKPLDFCKYLDKFSKKHQLNKGIFNNKVFILIEPGYTQADQKILYDCFEQLNYNKVEFINYEKIINKKRNIAWIIANNQYMHLIYQDYHKMTHRYFIEYKLFKNDINLIIKHLKTFLKNKDIIIMGTYSDIAQLASKLENHTNLKAFYIADTNEYIIKKIKNTLS